MFSYDRSDRDVMHVLDKSLYVSTILHTNYMSIAEIMKGVGWEIQMFLIALVLLRPLRSMFAAISAVVVTILIYRCHLAYVETGVLTTLRWLLYLECWFTLCHFFSADQRTARSHRLGIKLTKICWRPTLLSLVCICVVLGDIVISYTQKKRK